MSMIHIPNIEYAYLPRFKCGADPVSAALIYGGSGVLGSIVGAGSSSASAAATNALNEKIAREQMLNQKIENSLNRDFNSRQAQLAREFTTNERLAQQQFQQQQWDYQTQNAIPLAMQGAREAGLNPNVLASHQSIAGGSSVSAPTGASSPAASFATGISPVPFHAENPLNSFGSVFNQLASGLASLGQAKKSGVDIDLVKQQVQNLAIDEQYKKGMVDGIKLENDLKKVHLSYAGRKAVAEIENIYSDVAFKNSQYDINVAQQKLQPLFAKVQEELGKKTGQEAELLKVQVGLYAKQVLSQLQLQSAQAMEARANAVKIGSEKEAIDFMNSINKESGVKEQLVTQIFEATKSAKAHNKLSEAEYSKLMEATRQLQKANDNYEVQMWSNIINQTITTSSNAVGEFTRFGMVKKFLDSKQQLHSGAGYGFDNNGFIQPNAHLYGPWNWNK